jgi:hypothetical protein
MNCPSSHDTRDVTLVRCTLCGQPLNYELQATLHRKGTAAFDRHVQAELANILTHTRNLVGRLLTDAECADMTDAVTESITRFSGA